MEHTTLETPQQYLERTLPQAVRNFADRSAEILDSFRHSDDIRRSQAFLDAVMVVQFAEDGVAPGNKIQTAVNATGSAVQLLKVSQPVPESQWPWERLTNALEMAHGRIAMGTKPHVETKAVMLLGGIQERTIRNAISAGELIQVGTPREGMKQYLESRSAYAWLQGRRGFRPTRYTDAAISMSNIRTREAFGAFLATRRPPIEHLPGPLNPQHIDELERGHFGLPLDRVAAIAGAYALDADELLHCVMRVFFPMEYSALQRTFERAAAPYAASK